MFKSIKYICLYIILGYIMLSCSRIKDVNEKTTIDIAKIQEVNIFDLFDSIRINAMQTDNSCQISQIRKIIYWDKELYVFDKKQKAILIFKTNGEFSRKIHNIGKGPGEYLNIEDFTLNPYNRNIEFVDGYNLYVYKNDGQFINKVRIANNEIKSCNEIMIMNSDTIVFTGPSRKNIITLYSRKNQKAHNIQEIYPSWIKEKMPVNPNVRFYRNGSIVNYLEGFSNKVYSVNSNGFTIKYEWDFGKYNFNFEKQELSNLIQSSSLKEIMNNFESFTSKYVIQFTHNVENNTYILTDFLLKGIPATLIYNKVNKKYLVFNGELSNLIFSSQIEFIGEDKLIIVIDPIKIKNLPKNWFSKTNQEIINELNISSNPIILKLNIKKSLLQ